MTKPYKCRVEYLESSGTQWIKTDYTLTSNTKIDVLFSPNQQTTANLWVIGSYVASNKLTGVRITGETTIDCYINTTISKTVSGSNIGNRYQAVLDGKWTVNGSDGTAVAVSAGLSPLTLFGWNASSTANTYNISGLCSTKIYYCKIWDNGTLVRDFIPVLDNSGRPALYDNVSKQLFYNQGTGEFTYGRKIIPVEYLESSGTQYIDTGFKGKNNLHYKSKVNFTTLSTSGSNGIGGEYLGNAAAYIGMVRANGHFTYLFNNTAVETTTTFYTNTDYVIDSTMNAGSQVVKVNGETISTGTISGTFTSTRNIFLFAICSTNEAADVYGSLKMYYCQIYDNDILVRDFIPCIDGNNVPFMFDLVNCKIYENAGTGQFKVGANVDKSGNKNFLRKKLDMYLATLRKKRPYYCELEYLEGTGTQYINTGLLSTANSKVDCVFGFSSMEAGATNNCAVFGGRNNTTSQTFTFFKLASGNPQYFRFDYNNQRSIGTASNLTWNTASKYRFEYDGSRGTTTNITTGESAYESISPASTFTTSPITLFAVNTSNQAGQFMKGRIYRYWYTDGTNTIDLIPVLDWNYTPCMYDKISGKLFYNQGSGNFTAGREIHYVEYLETTSQTSTSTTKPWINTLVNYWADFEIGVKLRESASNVCLSCGGGSYRLERINATNPYWRFQGGGGSYNYDSTIPITEYHVLKWKDGKISCDDEVLVEKDHLLNSGTYTVLFTNSTSSGNTIYPNVVYFLKMWNPTDGTLVRDYLPAIDSNGVPFMFDRVTHTCFLNQGTGSFKYPAREVEYLESTGTQYIDTGIIGDLTTELSCEAAIVEAGNASVTNIMGNNVTSTRAITINMSANITNPAPSRIRFGNTDNTTVAGAVNLNTFYKYNTNKDNLTVQDIGGTILNIYEFNATTAFTTNGNILIYKLGDTSTQYIGKIKVSSASIKNSGVLVRDFIPVLQDGQAGMLDKVNNVFYSNAGTGSFGVGKIVESRWF